jgi:hypothetical protein
VSRPYSQELLSLGCAHPAELGWPGLAGHPAEDKERPGQPDTLLLLKTCPAGGLALPSSQQPVGPQVPTLLSL